MSPRSPSPLSEGEIVSGDEEKAISTSTNAARDSKVNNSARLPHGSSSRTSQSARMEGLEKESYYHSRRGGSMGNDVPGGVRTKRDRSRSRSPYRADRSSNGDKRKREDDHYGRKDVSDSRRFKTYYEDEPFSKDQERRSRRPYADLDRPVSPRRHVPYDDPLESVAREPLYSNGRDRRRGRDRSRSPFRHSTAQPPQDSMKDVTGNHDKLDAGKGALDERESFPPSSHAQKDTKLKMSLSQHANTKRQSGTQQSGNGIIKQDSEMTEDSTEPKQTLSESELIEQRRKRREAIKARHKGNPPLLVQALEHTQASAPSTPLHDSSGGPSAQQSPPSSMDSPSTTQKDSPPGSPAAFAVTNDEELVDRRNADSAGHEEDGPSAADYDPNLDMQEDRPDHKRQDLQDDVANGVDAEVTEAPAAVAQKAKEFDMFAEDDDDDDMFAPADATAKPAAAATTKQAKALDASLLDNWDYPDGHYRIILGELLDGRYAVQQQIGKGTFATVVRAQDTQTGATVAVKIACNNETMYKAGQKEMEMLELLNQNDQDDKKHIIRLLRQFEHKGHLCLVFENLSADLREVLKKFGRNVGLNLKAIRSYAQQMFLALSHLKKCQILHADLKPDNILVSEKRNLLKICDLGTASFAEDAEVTPYLVSRFYRAPEVILGMPFDYSIDMWSIGCTLFELYTGRILFAGADNNQMLRAVQECRGKFPMRMLKKSTLADRHFDFDGNFFSQERDKITGKATMRQINFNKTGAGKDLRSRLSGTTKGMKPEEIKEHAAFVDLMDKCLQLDPARRVSPNEALRHGFITHGTQQPEKAAPTVKVAMNVPRMR
ncbi:U4/U6 small nuclear ribonucleoprotein prp4 [Saxophila tyrrhenica]|uniref:non-specific serine/threonine protein kinase n=1 Tax=Saxophila tyrrhenica TaxID=1690608 RepID=A0AAV9P9K3_9PEZI|nr:U4/U6 small nuclear ribonucleoprotein prp4 [Saxophila tyrrhenica]